VYESAPVDGSKLLRTSPAANLLASKRLQDLKTKTKLSLRGMVSQSAQPLTAELVPDSGETVAAATATRSHFKFGDRIVSLEVTRGTAAKRSLQVGIVSPSGTCSGAAAAVVHSGSELSCGSESMTSISSDTTESASDAETAFEPAKKVPRFQARKLATRSVVLDQD
jgi:hypothetical protein